MSGAPDNVYDSSLLLKPVRFSSDNDKYRKYIVSIYGW